MNHNDRKQRTVRVTEQQMNQSKKRSTELGPLGCHLLHYDSFQLHTPLPQRDNG